jgi:hypothetical protein
MRPIQSIIDEIATEAAEAGLEAQLERRRLGLGPEVDYWRDLYRERWTGAITQEAFAHPAKFSRALIREIYDHVIKMRWVKPGDAVVDSFGGVGLGALDAMRNGLEWWGCELERKFVDLGQGCDCSGFTRDQWIRYQHRIAQVNHKPATGLWICPECLEAMKVMPEDLRVDVRQDSLFGPVHRRVVPSRMTHHYAGNIERWNSLNLPGKATLTQGDSRLLCQAIAAARCSVTSPPYQHDSEPHGDLRPDYGEQPKVYVGRDYGKTDGQLSALRGDDKDHEAALGLSSPPYVHALGHGGKSGAFDSLREEKVLPAVEYGSSPGQLENLPEGSHAVAVSSPPYPQQHTSGGGINVEGYRNEQKRPGSQEKPFDLVGDRTYQARGGERADGNLETMKEGDFDLAVGSPPHGGNYNSDRTHEDRDVRAGYRQGKGCFRSSESYGNTEGNLGNMQDEDFKMAVSSPPYAQHISGDNNGIDFAKINDGGKRRTSSRDRLGCGYGDSPGQMSAMVPGDFDAAITSPPFLEGRTSLRQDSGVGAEQQVSPNTKDHRREAYGAEAGQLAAMDEGDFNVAVSSPPFENVEGQNAGRKFRDPEKTAERRVEAYRTGKNRGNPASKQAIMDQLERENTYCISDDENNLGNQTGETFWSASRLILEQLFTVIQPGGHAVFVVKNFVRGGKEVDFTEQWARLCEAVGFKWVHHHKATLVEVHGEQSRLDGGHDILKTERKSFFRKVAEQKGSPPIDHESVLCFVKPIYFTLEDERSLKSSI